MSDSDIDGLKIFKFYEHHQIRAQIEVMKTEFIRYQDLDDSIKSLEERKDSKGKDTFDLSDWWKSNSTTLPGFAYVLYAVLTNSPNSFPPDCLSSYHLQCDLPMTTRSRHTPTTLNYRCSRSLTNEPSSSRVSRYRGKGRNGWGGWSLVLVWNCPLDSFGKSTQGWIYKSIKVSLIVVYSGIHFEIDESVTYSSQYNIIVVRHVDPS
jgi:hypothetical protein